jgi:hypothetical protein
LRFSAICRVRPAWLFTSLLANQRRANKSEKRIAQEIARLRLMHRFTKFIAPHVRNEEGMKKEVRGQKSE